MKSQIETHTINTMMIIIRSLINRIGKPNFNNNNNNNNDDHNGYNFARISS